MEKHQYEALKEITRHGRGLEVEAAFNDVESFLDAKYEGYRETGSHLFALMTKLYDLIKPMYSF